MTHRRTLFKGDLPPFPQIAAKSCIPPRVDLHEIHVWAAAGYNATVRAAAIF
jgi:hypothetical protein